MIDIDQRIQQFWKDNLKVNGSEEDGAKQIDENVKQLIKEVLESVKPERLRHDGSEEDWPQRFGHNHAIDEMEQKTKELGL